MLPNAVEYQTSQPVQNLTKVVRKIDAINASLRSKTESARCIIEQIERELYCPDEVRQESSIDLNQLGLEEFIPKERRSNIDELIAKFEVEVVQNLLHLYNNYTDLQNSIYGLVDSSSTEIYKQVQKLVQTKLNEIIIKIMTFERFTIKCQEMPLLEQFKDHITCLNLEYSIDYYNSESEKLQSIVWQYATIDLK